MTFAENKKKQKCPGLLETSPRRLQRGLGGGPRGAGEIGRGVLGAMGSPGGHQGAVGAALGAPGRVPGALPGAPGANFLLTLSFSCFLLADAAEYFF